jgi:phosphoglucomutase
MGVDGDGMAVPKTGDSAARPTLGAAADGDGDRNMILGDGVFVTPSDSLAVLSAHVGTAVPWFASKGGLRAIARSMPTSRAADVVASELGIPLFEVPTGWKYFGNLMDTPEYTPLICGEESFGTSSDHVREKDGMWATLAWVSLLAERNQQTGGAASALVGVAEVMQEHWEKHGRHYYLRYDYEDLDGVGAKALMAQLTEKVLGAAGGWAGLQPVASAHGLEIVAGTGVFSYDDPVDGSHAASQGVRIVLREVKRSGEQETLQLAGDQEPWNARVVFRLSGTGVGGATLRMYIERFAAPGAAKSDALGLNESPKQALATLAAAASELSRIATHTGADKPTTIT